MGLSCHLGNGPSSFLWQKQNGPLRLPFPSPRAGPRSGTGFAAHVSTQRDLMFVAGSQPGRQCGFEIADLFRREIQGDFALGGVGAVGGMDQVHLTA